MTTRNAVLISVAGLAVCGLYALALYPSLPEQLPIHWNVHGQADGWGHKSWAAFFGPAMMGLMLALMTALPWLSPRPFSVDTFRTTFNHVMLLTQGLFAFIHLVSLQAGLHPGMDSGRVLVAGLFLFFGLIGNMLGKVQRNFWMGIRTPWTLASDRVWTATHRLGARLMFGAGVIGALASFLGAPLVLCFTLLLGVVFVPVIYSLVLYKKLEREGDL
jgi:uncharacterized membrane protein